MKNANNVDSKVKLDVDQQDVEHPAQLKKMEEIINKVFSDDELAQLHNDINFLLCSENRKLNEFKSRYKKLMLILHPDKKGSNLNYLCAALNNYVNDPDNITTIKSLTFINDFLASIMAVRDKKVKLLTFMMGFHNKYGKDSSIKKHFKDSTIFDANLLRNIFGMINDPEPSKIKEEKGIVILSSISPLNDECDENGNIKKSKLKLSKSELLESPD